MTRHPDDRRPPGSPEDDATRLRLAEERIVIDKEVVERVAARIALRTHEEAVPVEQMLRREHLDIERVPVERIVAEPPQIREEDGVTIIPVVEEVLVRQFLIKEEIRIARHEEQIDHSETVTLRYQEVAIKTPDDDSA